ncbi:AraC family transcriptional regulator [Deinococcus radiotolerans]|uniref:AraC family transcriptional regulator n=1 Tax=Deinococcus radiotolerans TaxID=1309407 RepID=A0ABQ2FPE9_9DEIO|nr:AraC family transcriptional regulator [Deinococcus radiotolerans]GGL13882.1 AraC family transcriptional regulator [Deinococcus radiotolerans]
MDDPREWLRPAPDGSWPLEALLDGAPDLIFFVKDLHGRYVSVNDTLRRRSGAPHKQAVLGRTAAEVFTGDPGRRFNEQDVQAVRDGRELRDVLEMYFGPQGEPNWCLTHKIPLHDSAGNVVGLIGMSRDVPAGIERHEDFARVAQALRYMHGHFGQPLRMPALAARAGLSADSFERLMRRVCHMTPQQVLIRIRLDAALRLLRDPAHSISDIAHTCGYSDHSAFTRKFRAVTGISPQRYRERMLKPQPPPGSGGADTDDRPGVPAAPP